MFFLIFSHFTINYGKRTIKLWFLKTKNPTNQKKAKPRNQVNHDLNKNDLIILIPSGAGMASLKVTESRNGECCLSPEADCRNVFS